MCVCDVKEEGRKEGLGNGREKVEGEVKENRKKGCVKVKK